MEVVFTAEGSDFLCAPEKCHAVWTPFQLGQLSFVPLSDRDRASIQGRKSYQVTLQLPGNWRRTMRSSGVVLSLSRDIVAISCNPICEAVHAFQLMLQVNLILWGSISRRTISRNLTSDSGGRYAESVCRTLLVVLPRRCYSCKSECFRKAAGTCF
jgi:hypothetical protein